MVLEHGGRRVVMNAHPSAIIRLREAEERDAASGLLGGGLCVAAEAF